MFTKPMIKKFKALFQADKILPTKRSTLIGFQGAPSGLVASNSIWPSNLVTLATVSTNSRMVQATPVPALIWLQMVEYWHHKWFYQNPLHG
ncbi:MAG: hypothetical protein ACJA2G_002930 [Cognaticolwellia sp.]|jgi:hypothetical protein